MVVIMTSDSMLSRGKLGFQDMVIVINVYGSSYIVYNHDIHIEQKKWPMITMPMIKK